MTELGSFFPYHQLKLSNMNSAHKKRTLALVTDAYGGRGGIALYVRNLLQALCDYPEMARVVAIPRSVSYRLEKMPANLDYRTDAIGSKLKYVYACLRIVFSEPHFDLILCAHIHLLPLAQLLGVFYRCPVIPVVYGVDAWRPTRYPIVNYLCRQLKFFISIRKLTAHRLIEWAKNKHKNYYHLPNCIDILKYGIKPRSETLMTRYGIVGKTVIMTAGRLDPIAFDTRKGFDEIIEVLPALKERIPNLVYLIMGDGDDKDRLIKKAKRLGVEGIVLFTGYVQDAEKADHYRLADAFAMPGSNPIFDRYPYRFVFLEALACGVPVVGCRLEDPLEINDPDSQLIIQVDPNSKDEIIKGILTALSRPRGVIQPGLEKYYFDSFEAALHKIVKDVLAK